MVSINADTAETGLWEPEGSELVSVVKGTVLLLIFFRSPIVLASALRAWIAGVSRISSENTAKKPLNVGAQGLSEWMQSIYFPYTSGYTPRLSETHYKHHQSGKMEPSP